MTKKKADVKERSMTPEESDSYRAQMEEMTFGHLDDYFKMQAGIATSDEDEKKVYELAVRAFINEISYNGLPIVRRARYNRELGVSLWTFNLGGKAEEMGRKDSDREYYP